MCVPYVSFTSKVRPITVGCVSSRGVFFIVTLHVRQVGISDNEVAVPFMHLKSPDKAILIDKFDLFSLIRKFNNNGHDFADKEVL